MLEAIDFILPVLDEFFELDELADRSDLFFVRHHAVPSVPWCRPLSLPP